MLKISEALLSPLGTVHLYLDPGSGSILLQVLLAALLGAGIFVRAQWSRIRKWFGRGSTATSEEEADEDDE